ncbi:MAG TPA: ABC transporter permease [Solirubrobacteraceae bacterium]|nr:ABC transporter permease [Solirubrobacteraceae bacterium]
MRIGLALALLVVLLAVLGPLFAAHSPSAFVGAPFAPPSAQAPLGTDALGRDVLSRVLNGGRTVVWMSLAAASLGMVLGTFFALLAGTSRPLVDDVIMRTMDVLLALPVIIFTVLFISLLGPKDWLVVLLVGIAWVPQVARTARGATVEVAQRDFVRAAQALGVPRRKILLGEVLPNIMTPLTVEFGLRIVWSIGAIAALSFLGYGIQPPAADWGLMINENRTGLAVQPWSVIAPLVCIAVFAFAVNLMTEGLARTVAGVDRGTSN